jgi:hypothetical protein
MLLHPKFFRSIIWIHCNCSQTCDTSLAVSTVWGEGGRRWTVATNRSQRYPLSLHAYMFTCMHISVRQVTCRDVNLLTYMYYVCLPRMCVHA